MTPGWKPHPWNPDHGVAQQYESGEGKIKPLIIIGRYCNIGDDKLFRTKQVYYRILFTSFTIIYNLQKHKLFAKVIKKAKLDG